VVPVPEQTYLLRQVTDDVPHGEEFSLIMTIVCPLCANPNEILSQPSSISWKQVSCFSCEANLVLLRETVSGTPRRPLNSGTRLKPALPGTSQSTVFLRSRLFIAVATALAFGILGYLFWEAGFFENDLFVESSALPSHAPPPTSQR
jgi:ribosomal protein S27E